MVHKFELHDRVKILVSRFETEGIPADTFGYVIERYDDGALEIEVSNPDTGETISTIVAYESELDHAPEPPTPSPTGPL